MDKKVATVFLLLVVAGVAGFWLLRSARGTASAEDTHVSGSRRSTDSPTRDVGEPVRVARSTPTHVVQLPLEQRREVAEQISAAHTRRSSAPTSTSSGNGSDSANQMDTAEHVLSQLQAVIGEVKSHVAECQDRSDVRIPGFNANLKLTGDADIGTLIDAPALVGLDGKPLPKAFDDCVRGQLQTLELPPINTGDAFTVDLEFTF